MTIEEAISQISEWKGKEVHIYPLSGGLTNTNYRVEVDGRAYVMRLPGAKTELLAVDRANEIFNSRAAAEAGVAPEVACQVPGTDIIALQFIQGQTMSNASLNAPGMPVRIANALRQLHAGPRFLLDFNMFRLTEFYLKIVREHEVTIPEGYHDRMPTVQRIEAAMAVHPLPSVPCHNDLLAENYIDDGEHLWLVDWEYSGNNDPCFELGNTSQELQYDEDRIHNLCAAYFGSDYPDKVARMKLYMIMSDVGWGLWAAIQAKISKIEYDFWGWAIERWGRAVEKMDSPEFPSWLKDVAA